MPKTIRHIAVIRLSAMGDVAMTVPVLLAFNRQYPEVKITVVSRGFFEPIFNDIPNVSFFSADVNGRHKGLLGLHRLKKDLLAIKIEGVVDLHNVIRSRIVTLMFRLSGIPTSTVDKGRAERKALTRMKNKVFRQLPSVADRNSDAFERLGFKVELNPPVFLKRRSLSDEVKLLAGNKSKKWIGIAPFAKHDSKVYASDLMKLVIDDLSRTDLKVFLFGAGNDELLILKEYALLSTNIIVPGGRISFEEELQLISQLDAMLSMDSANAHLAAMFGIPVITLWGATHPYAGFAPFGQPSENSLLSDRSKFPMIPTSIYGNKKVEGYEDAMRTISPENVVKKVKSLLDII